MAIKIIKPGKKPDTTLTFTCENCGCVFTATDEDYEEEFTTRNLYMMSAYCPCCHRKICMDIDSVIKEKNHDRL